MKKFLICCLLLVGVFNVTTFALPSDLSAHEFREPGYIHEIEIVKKVVEPIGALCGVILIIFPFIKLFWLNKKINESEGEKFKLTGIFALKCFIITILFQSLFYYYNFIFWLILILLIIIIIKSLTNDVNNVFEYNTKCNFICTLLLCNVLAPYMIILPYSLQKSFEIKYIILILFFILISLALMLLPILVYKHKIKEENELALNGSDKMTILKKSFEEFLATFSVTTVIGILLQLFKWVSCF